MPVTSAHRAEDSRPPAYSRAPRRRRRRAGSRSRVRHRRTSCTRPARQVTVSMSGSRSGLASRNASSDDARGQAAPPGRACATGRAARRGHRPAGTGRSNPPPTARCTRPCLRHWVPSQPGRPHDVGHRAGQPARWRVSARVGQKLGQPSSYCGQSPWSVKPKPRPGSHCGLSRASPLERAPCGRPA